VSTTERGHRGGVAGTDVVVAMDYCLTDVWAVLPDRIVEHATIIVEEGRIAGVVENGPTRGRSISGQGSVCVPGLVDVHSTLDLAPSAEATGITTQFHALRCEGTHAADRFDLEQILCAGAAPPDPSAPVDHRPVICVDSSRADALVDAERCARACRSDRGRLIVSIADPATAAGVGADVETVLDWFTIQAVARRLQLVSRAPASADDVDRAVDWGAGAVEFPITLEAARRARERGLGIIAAAPGVLSTPEFPTAISPLALIELGLCDALASVDRPGSLVDAVSLLVLRGVCDLRGAVALVTATPADLAGLVDRGRLSAGLRGDLVLLHPGREHFGVRRTFRAGVPADATHDTLAS
jgi:alpha-D-ribose 1-methylphosphonate 5-triphosphate diphosphatase